MSDHTGSFAQLDATTGATAALPATDGRINAIAADGMGGWHIGGLFTKVGNAARSTRPIPLTARSTQPGIPLRMNGSFHWW